MGARTGHNGGNASKRIDERARIEPGHSIGSEEPSAPEWWPSPRYGRKTGMRPENRNSPGRIRDPSEAQYPLDSRATRSAIRRLPDFPSAVEALRALISKSSVDRS